ncbi:hypothetical protein ACH5RR_020186 [Cinchona calisaya]|uniref:Bifunctional inhibitor/plant lipid transfer protein/seed storage helical domain-containing protein n=1 Tax=Cinchona calisaya TaxID=153742 RepID=A0ABD2ZGQ8_9GENT
MEKKVNPLLKVLVVTTLIMLSNFKANGQITTSCTSSIISTFTPCFNYLTGSTTNGGSPTAQCCDSVKSLMTDSVDCACLIITGNVPVSLPFSQPLAISLPRICNGGVPLRCKAAGVPLPPPGPELYGPTQAPTASSPLSPKASMGAVVSTPPTSSAPSPIDTTADDITPASPPLVAVLGPVANPGIRPVLKPSASSPSHVSPPFLLLMFLGIMVFKSY